MDLINLNPKNQTSLFGYNKNFLKFINLYNEKKLPNKILLSGPKGIGKSTFAYHLVNYIFSKNEDSKYNINDYEINSDNRSYNLIINNTHPNFHLIDLNDDKKVIEISQIREMINYANKSTFNNKERIVLIDNAEYLNVNSSNALLKIIEEPNDNVFFILVFDNNNRIKDTLKSRCLKFNFYLSFNECLESTNKIIKGNLYDIISSDLIYHYNTIGDFINLINFSNSAKLNITNLDLKSFLLDIVNQKHYKKSVFIKKNIYKYIEHYLLQLIKIGMSKSKIYSLYENFINKVYHLKKFNLDEESFFIEFKTKILNG